ncbi:DUF488 domain-containing protein [Aciditerrimonas ferrireducens]|uniref:DUF488 domain-containing protein n=1 Tax=Aciditerrimonas ferrireducens TaxID=667306 RepID=A0ABV6BYW4_9ACTN
MAVVAARLHGDPGRQPGDHRVLVDRLWPRGVRRAALDLDEWAKDLAPSTELRRWYGHEPERFAAFADRYRAELATPEQVARCGALLARAAGRRLVLLTATRDLERSAASVLREVLEAWPPEGPPA